MDRRFLPYFPSLSFSPAIASSNFLFPPPFKYSLFQCTLVPSSPECTFFMVSPYQMSPPMVPHFPGYAQIYSGFCPAQMSKAFFWYFLFFFICWGWSRKSSHRPRGHISGFLTRSINGDGLLPPPSPMNPTFFFPAAKHEELSSPRFLKQGSEVTDQPFFLVSMQLGPLLVAPLPNFVCRLGELLMPRAPSAFAILGPTFSEPCFAVPFFPW